MYTNDQPLLWTLLAVTMIEEAVLELRLVLHNGAVLSLCQNTVKVTELLRVRGKLDLASDHLEKQRVEIVENIALTDAKLPEDRPRPSTADQFTEPDPDFPFTIKTEQQPETMDSEVQTEADCAETQECETQTDPIEGGDDCAKPVMAELIEQLGELEAARLSVDNPETDKTDDNDKKIDKPKGKKDKAPLSPKEGTSDGPVGRPRRKRRVIRQVSSEEEDNDADDADYRPPGQADQGMEAMTHQWTKDLQRVIRSLEQDEDKQQQWTKDLQRVIRSLEHDEDRKEVKSVKNAPPTIHKRKRGKPRKVQQPKDDAAAADVATDSDKKTVKEEKQKDKDEDVSLQDEDDDKTDTEVEVKSQPLKKKAKRLFHCAGCDATFPKKALLKEHKETCEAPVPSMSNRRFNCSQCDKAYRKLTHLRRHEKVHKDVKEYACSVCSKAFIRKEHRDKHEQTHQVFKCSFCEQVITGKAKFLRHETSHLPPSQQAAKEVRKKTTPCRFCGKLFQGRAQCEQHEVTHTKERPYKCSYCDLYFSKRGNTLKHERRIHLRLKPFMCMFCGKTFAQKPDCKKHEMRHLGEKRVKCNFCDKMFLENHHRIVHERTHTGERPYKCVICNHAFAQSYDCKKHMRIHLKENGTTRHKQPAVPPAVPRQAQMPGEDVRAVDYLQQQVCCLCV